MKNSTRICLITAGICIVLGIVLTVLGYMFGGHGSTIVISNGKWFYSHELVTVDSEKYTDIDKIVIDVDNYPIEVRNSEDDTFSFTYAYSDVV